MDLTPETILTAFVAGAALITGLVEIFKKLLPGLGGHEQQLAALLAVALIGAGTWVQASTTPPTDPAGFVGLGLGAVLGWYGLMRIAMGVHDDVTQAPNSLTGPNAQG